MPTYSYVKAHQREIQIQPMLRLNDTEGYLGYKVAEEIQIQPMLRLNLFGTNYQTERAIIQIQPMLRLNMPVLKWLMFNKAEFKYNQC